MRTISRPPPKLKTGILLINLGTPDATDQRSVRRYLKQFLSDKHVVPAQGPIWWLVLNLIILRRRPASLGRAYAAIWNTKRDESPLRTHTRAQAEGVADIFKKSPQIMVDWAMRYGTPSISEGIARLTDAGCDRLLFFPLYPQYSLATTASAMAAVFETLKTYTAQPAICSVPAYFDHPAYISALVESLQDHLSGLSWKPEVTLASFHGLPVDFITKGDPYQSQCEATTDLLRTALNLPEDKLLLSYQSRTSRKEWIGPGTEETLHRLAREGVKNLTIITPGFAADGVETLEELGLRATKTFTGAGGENISIVPCLNASACALQMLKTLAEENLFYSR